MKLLQQSKSLFILLLSIAFLSSCENEAIDFVDPDSIDEVDEVDDMDQTDDENVLVTKIVVEFEGAEEDNYTVNYSYDGKRITKATYSDDGDDVYTYNGNNQLINFTNNDDNNTPDIIEDYTYDDQGRVATVTTDVGDNVHTDNLTYNSDNTVILYNDDSGDDPLTVTLLNGNIIESDQGDGYIDSFTYGNQNGPFKNLENREVLSGLDTEINIAYLYSLNNIQSLDETYIDFNNQPVTDTSTYTYTYTDLGYPRVVTETYQGEFFATYTYTYNTD